jgi:hypothetical protein
MENLDNDRSIEVNVVKKENLPAKFQAYYGSVPSVENIPKQVLSLIGKATEDFDRQEKELFLRRLKEEHPELFSGKRSDDAGERPEEEWRKELIRILKEEANRFMAAAAGM